MYSVTSQPDLVLPVQLSMGLAGRMLTYPSQPWPQIMHVALRPQMV